MKKIIFFAASIIFAATFVSSVSAQGAAQPAGSLRVAVIDTATFATKEGITRYLNAANALQTEFKPVETEIQQLATKYQNLGNEIKKLQDQVAAGSQVPIDQKSAQAKVEEYQSLEVQIKRKQEDANQRFERRQQQVMGPIMQEIGKAIQEFGTQKGYDIIIDLANAPMVLHYNPAKADITKEFITFFNSRPATAATAAAPR